MDRQQLRRELHAKVDAALDKAIDAVSHSPDGRWIAGSEWVVRAAFAELMGDCFQAIVQARIDADPAAVAAGSFSPDERRAAAAAAAAAAANDAAVQGVAARKRVDRRR
jgi:hypothetical protein